MAYEFDTEEIKEITQMLNEQVDPGVTEEVVALNLQDAPEDIDSIEKAFGWIVGWAYNER